eukprot:763986-Hanusia_phi.AAC.6
MKKCRSTFTSSRILIVDFFIGLVVSSPSLGCHKRARPPGRPGPQVIPSIESELVLLLSTKQYHGAAASSEEETLQIVQAALITSTVDSQPGPARSPSLHDVAVQDCFIKLEWGSTINPIIKVYI